MPTVRYYGYNIVAASFLIQGVTIGGMFAYGVLFKELETEFGWSRTTLSGASSLAFLSMGVFGVLAGRLNDQIGPRWLLSGSAVVYAVGYALLSRLEAPWQLFLYYGLLVGIGMSTHDVVTLSTVARWFTRRRGLMSGLVKVGTGCGQLVVPLVVAALMEAFGWRMSCLLFGTAALLVLFAGAQVMRRDPQSMGLLPDAARVDSGGGPAPSVAGISFRDAAASPQLWILCAGQFVVFSCALTVMVHIAPHAMDLGTSRALAAGVLSAVGGFSMLGRITIGGAIDRIGGRHALIICFVVLLASLAWLQVARNTWMLYSFAAVYGVAHGGFFTVMSPTIAELFGTRAHGALFGTVLLFGAVGGATGPLLAGAVFDATGSYRIAFLALCAVAVLGLVLVSLLRPARATTESVRASET